MSISDNQPVDAANSNAAWVSKTVNSDIIGIPSLKNNSVGSGAHVINPQKAFNKLFDAAGVAGESDTNSNIYSSTNSISNGDSYKTAIEKLDAQVGVIAESDTSTFLVELNKSNSGVPAYSSLEFTTDYDFGLFGTITINNLTEVTI